MRAWTAACERQLQHYPASERANTLAFLHLLGLVTQQQIVAAQRHVNVGCTWHFGNGLPRLTEDPRSFFARASEA